MYDIPQIVEGLYYQLVTIPEQKDWPDYLGGNVLAAHDLYSFYYGLQTGFQLSDALRERGFSPAEE